MRVTRALLTATVVVLVCGLVQAAQTMYARMQTEVRDGRSFAAAVVTRLEQGDPVQILGRTGRHYKVAVDGRSGWIYYNKLTEEKPEDISALLGSGPSTAGMDLDEMEAGGALRGLSPAAEKYAMAEDIPRWAVEAVERMQKLKTTPEDLESFARQGKLGEYMEVHE